MANRDKLFVKRYKTLKEHRAAVAARKQLQAGKNRGPVANNDAYGETLQKPKPKPKPAKPATAATAAKPAKPAKPATAAKPAKPVQAKSKPIPSNPQLKTQSPKPSTKRTNRVPVDPRERGRRNNVREMEQAARRRRQRQAFTNTGMPARPSSNPKKGDKYKKAFGNVMVYDGKKWVRSK